jgi:hypothetical protein
MILEIRIKPYFSLKKHKQRICNITIVERIREHSALSICVFSGNNERLGGFSHTLCRLLTCQKYMMSGLPPLAEYWRR